MKRFAFLAVLAIATLGMTSSGIAATKSNWRALNDDLAPVNVKLAEDVQALSLNLANLRVALDKVAQDAASLSYVSPFESGGAYDEAASEVAADVAEVRKLQDAVQELVKAVSDDAVKGIKVLDSYAPEKCSAHFVALEYTMFMAWSETVSALRAGEPTNAAGTAFWLGGFSGVDGTRLPEGGPIDAEWSRTKCQGASPSPGPSTAAESPGPS